MNIVNFWNIIIRNIFLINFYATHNIFIKNMFRYGELNPGLLGESEKS